MARNRDYSEGVKVKKGPSWGKALMPILGIIIMIAAGAVAYVASEPAYEWLRTTFPEIPNDPALQLVVGVGIFLLIVMIVALIYSVAFAKKPEYMVTEQELGKERKQKQEEEEAARRRQKLMREKMRESRRRK